jgi:hydroxypyruvate isomerase
MGRWAEPRGEREDRAVNTEGLRFDVNCSILLAAQGYAGWIGCEHEPRDPADSSTSFGWREPHEV